MNQVFVAFIIIAIMLELFKLNRLRIVNTSSKNVFSVLSSIITTGLIYGIFILSGWYAQKLLPEFSVIVEKIISVTLLGVMIAYVVLRDKRYNQAGKLIYENFNLFVLVAVGRGVVHIITGFIMAIMHTGIVWLMQSYALGVVLFGLGAVMAKGEQIRIFGISVGYIKIVAYTIAAFLIFLN